jgi:hypothetical protein
LLVLYTDVGSLELGGDQLTEESDFCKCPNDAALAWHQAAERLQFWAEPADRQGHGLEEFAIGEFGFKLSPFLFEVALC